MAYVKTVWQTGDVITAAKLNNAENGIEAASPYILDLTGETWVVDGEICRLAASIDDLVSAWEAGKEVRVYTPAYTNETDSVPSIAWCFDAINGDVVPFVAFLDRSTCPNLNDLGYADGAFILDFSK